MDKKESRELKRIERSKLNTTVALVTNIIMGVLSFAERTVFNQFFIEDYLGLYSFNNNIIYILSFFELGLSTAVAYSLYEPLELGQRDRIAAIMSFFRKAYIIIGVLILTSGILILPVLPLLIKTSVPMSNVRLYFILFLLGNVSSYFINYRNILLNADQAQYRITLVTNISWTVLYALDIVIAVTTRNFLLYSISILAVSLVKNIILNRITSREFPYLKEKSYKIKLDGDTKDKIIRNTKGLIATRLGIAMVTCTDSLLISALVGTNVLGKYSNYQMLTTGLMTLAVMLPQSITASIGNAGVTESKRTMSRAFSVLDLSSFFIYATLSILLFNVINPIVATFFGPTRTLPFSTVVIICTNFYLQAMRELLLSYKTSLGLYWEDRKRPIAEGLTNLISSIILGHFWGLNGILIGTMLTSVCINFVIEPRVIFHHGFGRSAYGFYLSNILRFILVVVLSALTHMITSSVSISTMITGELAIGNFRIGLGSLSEFLFNAVSSLLITLTVFLLVFGRTESVRVIRETLRKAKGKKKNVSI